MSAISGYISQIKNAVYGEQVRGAIVSALEACYSDVNAPSLQTEAFEAALNEAYAGGILDIQTVTSFSDMTNQKIIYRYNGTAAGKQKGLYYYSALSSSWVLIGSEIQKVSLVSQMTDINDIYKYIGTESGMVQNSLYCHNGTAWVPIGSGVLIAATASEMTNTDAIYKYTGSESGYVTNALYYYNGTSWVLVSEKIELDNTLTDSDKPAQAKAVGDKINEVNERIDEVSDELDKATEIILPRLNIIGDLSLMTGEKNSVTYPYVWTDENETRAGWLKAKWQGNSSLSWPKKNYTLTFYNDASTSRKDKKASFFDLGSGSKWVVKANFTDHSQARNVVSARVWGEVVKTRTTAPQTELENAPNFGATNGYPIEIYNNGQYWGLYTLIIPKDDYMLGMDEDNPLNCALQAGTAGSETTPTATQFRVVSMAGWDLEFPDEKPSGIDTGFLAVIDFVLNSSDADFVANFNNYIDLPSAIDYYLFAYFMGASDSLTKNLMMLTYDGGTKWICTYWDLDSDLGLNFNGNTMFSPYMRCPEDYADGFSLLWERMEENFGQELYDRYTELRQSAFSIPFLTAIFTQFCNSIGEAAYDRDVEKWPTTPQATTNNLNQIIGWITARAPYVDGMIYALAHDTVPCTGVSFSSETITVRNGKTASSGVIVSPPNTTDVLIVTSSNSSVVSVSADGTTLTGVSIGTATLTASCGTFTATATVEVVSAERPALVWSDSPSYTIGTDGEIVAGNAYVSEKQAFPFGAVIKLNLSSSDGTYAVPRAALYKGSDFIAKTENANLGILVLAGRSVVVGLRPTNEAGQPSAASYTYLNYDWIAVNTQINAQTGELEAYNAPVAQMILAGNRIMNAEPIPVIGGGVYRLHSAITNASYLTIYEYDANGNYLGFIGNQSTSQDAVGALLPNCSFVYVQVITPGNYDTIANPSPIQNIITFSKE